MRNQGYGSGHNQRLRTHRTLRDMVKETSVVSISDLILPLFIRYGDESIPIKSMPGQKQWCLKDLSSHVAELKTLGIKAVMLFGIPQHKDEVGSDNTRKEGIIPTAIRMMKDAYPELLVISDMCLCDYSSHGHCFILDDNKHFDMARTHNYLMRASITHAESGSDVIAPSGNVDHMVKAIRSGLDEASFSHVPILSYSAKYCSALYGPFREACDSAPKYFDRSQYQLDVRNSDEGVKEALCDIAEGADIVMVKPASLYLDVLHKLSASVLVPVIAYQVSGEYSMIELGAQAQLFDKEKMVSESLHSIKRAGACAIITYFAKDYAQWTSR